MNWTDLNLMPAMPEIVLLSALGIVLLVDLWTSDKNRYITHVLSLLADLRGGRSNDPRFGHRMRGNGVLAELETE